MRREQFDALEGCCVGHGPSPEHPFGLHCGICAFQRERSHLAAEYLGGGLLRLTCSRCGSLVVDVALAAELDGQNPSALLHAIEAKPAAPAPSDAGPLDSPPEGIGHGG